MEIALYYSLQCPICWSIVDNKFIAQKIVRSERNVIQFMEECSGYDKDLSYRLKPGSCNFSNIEFDTTININQDGFRVSSDSTVKDNNCTIAFLGDSLTMGWGVEDYETYSSIISNKMRCNGYNMGVSSYGTVREVLRLNESNMPIPDYIVLQYADNDLKENRSFYNNSNSLDIMSEDKYNSIRSQYLIKKEYFFYKYTYVLFKGIFTHFKKRYNKLSKGNADKIKEVDYFYNAILKLKPKFKEVKLIIFELNSTNRNDNSFISALRKKYYKKLQEKFPNIILLSIEKDLNINNYFVFDDHMNVSGHKIIANKLEKFLLGRSNK